MSYREKQRKRKEAELRQVIEKKNGLLLSEYVNNRTNVLIRCEGGHKWEVRPYSVKSGDTWCPHCYHKKEQMILELQEIITRKGGTLLSEYVNNHTDVLIRCVEGHEWEVRPHGVKNIGSWCPHCYHKKEQKSRELREYVEAQNGTLLSEYVSSNTKVLIRCGEGHEWEATPTNIKNQGTWCPYCAHNTPATLEELQQLGRDKGGAYLTIEAVSAHTKAFWSCAEGHIWEARPNDIKNGGSWCPTCRNKSENAVRTMLKYALEINFPSHSPKALERLGIELRNAAGNQMTLDGFCLDIVCAFEFHGYQHTNPMAHLHALRGSGSFQRRQKDDELKREQCERLGIVLFEIYEEECGVWPHLNQLYSGLLDVLEGNGIQVTGKPNMSDSAWMQLIASDRHQTNLDDFIA